MRKGFFWYQLTRVVPDKGPQNGCCLLLSFVACYAIVKVTGMAKFLLIVTQNTEQILMKLQCLQCFDAVVWVAGRAFGLYKLSGEVLAWLSAWSEVQMICIWSS